MQVDELEQLIIDLCLDLQSNLNQQEIREHKMPNNEVLYRYTCIPYQVQVEYTACIYVNRLLIFREIYIRERISMDKVYEQIQDEQSKFNVVRKLIESVFSYGIMSSKKFIDDRMKAKKISEYEEYLKQLKNTQNDGGKIKGTDAY